MSETTTTRPGVVVHQADGDPIHHRAVVQNVRNTRGAPGPQVPVELVVHGPRLDLVARHGSEAPAIAELLADDVGVLGCLNTMRSRAVSASDLVDGVGTVDSGVAHLARRQLEGWAYLRP